MKRILGILFKVLTLVFIITVICSCGSDSSKDTKETMKDSTSAPATNNVEVNTQYKLPFPVELYEFLFNSKAKYNSMLLNPVANKGKYISSDSKSINFGIYASDLAYCSCFGKNQETFKYFSTCKLMADEIGLISGFDQKIVKRIDNSVNNKDSLLSITKGSFSDVLNVLQSQGQIKLLPLIVAGAWIESVYIAINSVEKFSAEDPIVLRIADQQLLLENLLDYFKSIPEKDQNKEIFKKFSNLQGSFDKLYDNTDIIISKAQFTEISRKVIELRTDLITKKQIKLKNKFLHR
jgi:hypothetical protein